MLFALFFFLIGGTFLFTAILSILLPFLTAALTMAAAGLLLWNAVLLLCLLLLRRWWKRAGRLEAAYIHSFSGWKRRGLQGVKLLLTAGIVWEVLMLLFCLALLLFHPLDHLLPYWAVE